MTKRLSDVIEEITRRIPRTNQAPRRPEPAVCPICLGAGFLRMDAPVGDPNFGRVMPCDCRLAEADEQMRRELEAISNMEAFADKTFDRFDLRWHDSSRLAFETARAYAENPVGWLLLSGPCGSGKTHLAAAIAHHAISVNRVKSLFMIVPDLLDYLREAFNPRSEVTYDERFETTRGMPLLVLDDLGTENATTWAREKLFQIINHRYNAQLPTVITTNQPLESIDERIRSRVSDVGLVKHVQLAAPDYRQRGLPTRTSRRPNQR